MIRLPAATFFFALTLILPASLSAIDPSPEAIRVFSADSPCPDARLGKLRNLNDAYHPWIPPKTKADWEREAERIRTQLFVSNGLWPMWPKTPLNAVVHGEIPRGDYVVRKVFFESLPGHYVSGNLYLPTNPPEKKMPGILSPHGHWADGRFYDAGTPAALKQIEQGAEHDLSGARYPLQARMAHLARMGCVVFHYDMVGNADSKQIGHAAGFTDVESGLWLQNAMGLQTWNSIRALDFLLSLENVDPDRIGVTGASGGGTQTFMLAALDERVNVAFPAVMVSTAMQGGCICENADYLRQGVNNIAFAALFAPKPLAMSGANDWTIQIEERGLPELKQIWSLYGAEDKVYAEAHPEFGHNYNYISRAIMYRWFKEYLGLDESAPVEETDFWPISKEELSVFDGEHPRPANATGADGVREYLTTVMTEQWNALIPGDADSMAHYRKIVDPAAKVLLDSGVPSQEERTSESTSKPYGEGLELITGHYSRKDAGEAVPFALLVPDNFAGHLAVWFDDAGKSHLFDNTGQPSAEVQQLLKVGVAVGSADLFLTGELIGKEFTDRLPVDERYSGYTFGYNKTILAQRVHDLLTGIGGVADTDEIQQITLIGTGKMGAVCLLARGLAGDTIDRCVVNLNGFSFDKVTSTQDPMFLPGALRYGGLGGLAGLGAPHPLTIGGDSGLSETERNTLAACYKSSGGKLTSRVEDFSRKEIVDFVLKN
ncbi:MAG TPA: acetylxylan esterase [Planctomycetaceae bacterium]|nr:acetylxylan esterase [Planctomycetaceae bacterium]